MYSYINSSQMDINYYNPGYEYYSNRLYQSTMKFTKSQVDLINLMRMLWEQHDVWTRAAIVSLVFNLPDTDLVIKRLLRNPTDFEKALIPFYGNNIAAKFSALLKDHLVIASELVKAAKAGNNNAAAAIEKRWYANADEIAMLLGSINPYWSQEMWRSMLHDHLRLVKAEAVNMLQKNYEAGIAVYDEIERQSLGMADTLAEGIMKQFPQNFIY